MLDSASPIQLRLILDASSIELFVNSQFSVTARSYAKPPGDQNKLTVTINDPKSIMTNIGVW